MTHKSNRGFTLIEMMIVVLILSIVVAWGYNSYRDTVIKSRRAEGMGELLTIADKLERFYADRGTYVGANLGTMSNAVHTLCSDNGYYCFNIKSATTVRYEISAAPQGGQNNDTKCGTFTLDSTGIKTAGNNSCW